MRTLRIPPPAAAVPAAAVPAAAVLAVAVLAAACTAPPSPQPGPTPTASASAPAPGCPAPGVLITADRGDAAAGYREMSLRLTNCGDAGYPLRGRPDIVVLDDHQRPLKVTVVASIHYTAGPRRMTVQPRTGVTAVLSWRNTVTVGTAVTGAALSVAPVEGAPRQLVTLPAPMDLGTTGRLEASAWF